MRGRCPGPLDEGDARAVPPDSGSPGADQPFAAQRSPGLVPLHPARVSIINEIQLTVQLMANLGPSAERLVITDMTEK